MKNYQQESDVIQMTAPYAVASGAGMLVGSMFGVAQTTVATGVKVEAAMKGVFVLAKATALAWVEGDKIYWDNAAKNTTTAAAAGANKQIGVAILQVSGLMPIAADTTGTVMLSRAYTI